MHPSNRSRLSSTAVRRGLLLGLVGFLLTSVVVVNTLAVTDVSPNGPGDQPISLNVNSFINDVDVSVTTTAVIIIPTNAGAVGDSPTGVEPTTSAFPVINNVLNADNYAYRFNMQETSAGAWGVGENFRIEVYGYLISTDTNTLITTLYTDQAVADGGLEGVTATIDLGSPSEIYDNIDIVITRQ